MGFWIEKEFFSQEYTRCYVHLDEIDKNGKLLPRQDTPVVGYVDDDTDGVAPILYNYLEKNLP